MSQRALWSCFQLPLSSIILAMLDFSIFKSDIQITDLKNKVLAWACGVVVWLLPGMPTSHHQSAWFKSCYPTSSPASADLHPARQPSDVSSTAGDVSRFLPPTWIEFWVLTLACPSPACCWHLGSDAVDERRLSVLVLGR